MSSPMDSKQEIVQLRTDNSIWLVDISNQRYVRLPKEEGSVHLSNFTTVPYTGAWEEFESLTAEPCDSGDGHWLVFVRSRDGHRIRTFLPFIQEGNDAEVQGN